MTTYEQELTDKCTAEHPDHQYLFEVRGRPLLWTVWCSKCDELGYNTKYDELGRNTDNAHNCPNPAMSAEYVEAVSIAACLVYLEEERISAERRQKRAERRIR